MNTRVTLTIEELCVLSKNMSQLFRKHRKNTKLIEQVEERQILYVANEFSDATIRTAEDFRLACERLDDHFKRTSKGSLIEILCINTRSEMNIISSDTIEKMKLNVPIKLDSES